MKRSTLRWLGLTAAAAVLTAGCVARGPAPRPGPGTTAGSTTGDADACAVALGNTVEGRYQTDATNRPATGAPEPTANGILIGNVALVGLPTADEMSVSPSAPGGTAPGGAAVPHPAPAGSLAASDTVRDRPNPVAPLAPAGQPNPPGGAFDRTATPGATGFGGSTTGAGQMAQGETGTPPGNGTALTAPGTAATGNDAGVSALDRIRTACPKVTQIRVVNDAKDRAQLANIAMAIRKGEPITDFLDEISRISRKAQVAGAGVNTTLQPGEAPAGTAAPAPAAPAAPGATIAPAPGATGTVPRGPAAP